MISEVMAQAAAPAQQVAPNPIASFMPFILIGLVFYFLMFRPQQKKLKKEQAFLSALSKGDEVFTKAGIIGKITGVTDKIITLEIGEGTKLKVIRSQIGGLASKLFEQEKKG